MPKTQPRRTGQIVKRGEGKFLVRVFVGREDGKKKYVSKTIDGTISQAKQALTKMLRESDTDTLVVRSNATVKEFLGLWLASKKVLPQTLKNYETTLRGYVYDRPIGKMRLSEVERGHVQAYYNALEAEGYSPRTIQYVHMILRQAFDLAVRDSKLQRNPCEFTERRAVVSKKGNVLTPEETTLLLDKNADSKHYALWLLLLTAGMRPQEILPLRWSDIDGDAVTIRRVYALVGGKRVVQEGRAKTKGSLRTIGISDTAVRALKAQRVRVAELRLKHGADWQDNDLVFPGRQGSMQGLKAVRDHWKAALQRAGLGERRLYDTRHTFITQRIEEGAPAAVVAAYVGNSAKITLDVYTNISDERTKGLAAATEKSLFGRAVQS